MTPNCFSFSSDPDEVLPSLTRYLESLVDRMKMNKLKHKPDKAKLTMVENSVECLS